MRRAYARPDPGSITTSVEPRLVVRCRTLTTSRVARAHSSASAAPRAKQYSVQGAAECSLRHRSSAPSGAAAPANPEVAAASSNSVVALGYLLCSRTGVASAGSIRGALMLKRRIALLLATGASAGIPAATAEAYVECGNPAGPATNVTATRVSCSDARSFARKFANRNVTSSLRLSLPGWRSYYPKVRRAGGEYDVRATRANKVIRFQYGAEMEAEVAAAATRTTREPVSARTQVTTTARAVPATGPTTPDTSRSSEMTATTSTSTATGTALPARTDAGQRDT
jgi:hypothetical protein